MTTHNMDDIEVVHNGDPGRVIEPGLRPKAVDLLASHTTEETSFTFEEETPFFSASPSVFSSSFWGRHIFSS